MWWICRVKKILCAEKKNPWETRHFPRRWEKRKKIRKRSTEKKNFTGLHSDWTNLSVNRKLVRLEDASSYDGPLPHVQAGVQSGRTSPPAWARVDSCLCVPRTSPEEPQNQRKVNSVHHVGSNSPKEPEFLYYPAKSRKLGFFSQ